jgi:putative ABC transport system permease protein
VVAARLPVQRLESVSIDGAVLVFALLAAAISALLFGIAPALTIARSALASSLKEAGRSAALARGNRTRRLFVVVEVALALVLLTGAGLLVRSFVKLQGVNAGFDQTRVVTMNVALPGSRYGQPAQRIQFHERLFARLSTLPGVESVGAISSLPLAGPGAATKLEVIGRPNPPAGQEHVTDVRVVGHEYFRSMHIPLVKGRLFDPSDKADAASRVIVNETMVRRFWPDEDPLGKKIRVSWNDVREDEIIGVVSDVRSQGLETEPRPMIYWPYARFPYPGMTLTFRAGGDTAAIVRAATAVVREQDPALAVSDVRTMEDVVSDAVAQRRLTVQLIAMFAVAALILAALGIYGVIAYTVTQRTPEIGIRMALGAQRSRVLAMVVGEAMMLTAAGIAAGLAASLLLTRLMKDLLFEVPPGDPATLGAVTATLILVALAASYLPGRRATRVDPVVALRAE